MWDAGKYTFRSPAVNGGAARVLAGQGEEAASSRIVMAQPGSEKNWQE